MPTNKRDARPQQTEEPIPIDRWARHLEQHVPIAREGSDIEGVHQVRVATRRLDVFLRMASMRLLRDDLRWLRQSAGHVRDLDVQLAEMGHPEPFAGWLREEHADARRDLVEHLDAPRLSGLLRGLSVLPPVSRRRARAGVRKLARDTCRVGKALEDAPEDVDRLHRLRRSLRRLRYGLEWMDEGQKFYKRLQDSLGHVGDLAVAIRLVDACPLEGLDDYREGLRGRLEQARDAAVADWRDVRDQIEELR